MMGDRHAKSPVFVDDLVAMALLLGELCTREF